MSNTNIQALSASTQAQDIRDELLKDGRKTIQLLKKIAHDGIEESDYTGDIKSLHVVVKLLTPLMSLRDDKVKITKDDKQEYEDRLVQLAMDGEISVVIAQEMLTVITKSKELGDLREVISKLDALEMSAEK